jgi:hypothetical protein
MLTPHHFLLSFFLSLSLSLFPFFLFHHFICPLPRPLAVLQI